MQNKLSKSQYINILLLIIVATFLMWIVIDQDENILDRIRNCFKCLMIVILGGILIALTIMEKTMKNMNITNK
jgi:cytochrome bd-type quinol oxidase subunit 2